MKSTTPEMTYHNRARSLLDDLRAVPTTFVPRREPIVAWLNSFAQRSKRDDFVLGETEEEDLGQVHEHVRTHLVPLAKPIGT